MTWSFFVLSSYFLFTYIDIKKSAPSKKKQGNHILSNNPSKEFIMIANRILYFLLYALLFIGGLALLIFICDEHQAPDILRNILAAFYGTVFGIITYRVQKGEA